MRSTETAVHDDSDHGGHGYGRGVFAAAVRREEARGAGQEELFGRDRKGDDGGRRVAAVPSALRDQEIVQGSQVLCRYGASSATVHYNIFLPPKLNTNAHSASPITMIIIFLLMDGTPCRDVSKSYVRGSHISQIPLTFYGEI